MTMQIRIENRDSTRTAIVTTTEGPRDEPEKQHVSTAEIAPLATADFWLHSGKWIEVTEKT